MPNFPSTTRASADLAELLYHFMERVDETRALEMPPAAGADTTSRLHHAQQAAENSKQLSAKLLSTLDGQNIDADDLAMLQAGADELVNASILVAHEARAHADELCDLTDHIEYLAAQIAEVCNRG